MAKKDPTKESAFQKVIGVFLNTAHKPHDDMKLGKKKKAAKKRRQKART